MPKLPTIKRKNLKKNIEKTYGFMKWRIVKVNYTLPQMNIVWIGRNVDFRSNLSRSCTLIWLSHIAKTKSRNTDIIWLKISFIFSFNRSLIYILRGAPNSCFYRDTCMFRHDSPGQLNTFSSEKLQVSPSKGLLNVSVTFYLLF